MKEKFLSWQGTKRRELFLSCCGFDSYISFVGKKLLSAFGTVYCSLFMLWTHGSESRELKVGEVRHVQALGLNLAVFRLVNIFQINILFIEN